jgi:hypothetical protein
MAVYTAGRINRFLDLPVTIITDRDSITDTSYTFDKTIIIEADRSNYRGKSSWINKGRYQVYDLSPYHETLVLDTDYMVNSRTLLDTFKQPSDIVCYQDSKFLLLDQANERMHHQTLSIYWATVIRFNKSDKARDVFRMIEMVQKNYEHYSDIHKFMPHMYRNDYALTIALRTVNGQLDNKQDAITGRLIHAGSNLVVDRIDDTTYNIKTDVTTDGKTRTQYITVSDYDFHMLDKANFMRIAG